MLLRVNFFFISVMIDFIVCRSDQRARDDEMDDSDRRMWNASLTSYEEHPYFVVITAGTPDGEFEAMCGGVFVTAQVVLTAAHCVYNPRTYQIRYGTNKAETTSGQRGEFGEGFDYKVTSIYSYPGWSEFLEFADYSLLRLDVPIKHKHFVINLPEPGEDEEAMKKPFNFTQVSMGSSIGNDTGWLMKEVAVSEVNTCPWRNYSIYSLCSRNQTFISCYG